MLEQMPDSLCFHNGPWKIISYSRDDSKHQFVLPLHLQPQVVFFPPLPMAFCLKGEEER